MKRKSQKRFYVREKSYYNIPSKREEDVENLFDRYKNDVDIKKIKEWFGLRLCSIRKIQKWAKKKNVQKIGNNENDKYIWIKSEVLAFINWFYMREDKKRKELRKKRQKIKSQ